MISCWDFVARPSSTTSSPVAKGSSVPACPTRGALRLPPSARRTAATTSCELTPAGLSIRSTASNDSGRAGLDGRGRGGPVGGRVQLRGDRGAQEREQLV